MKEDQIREAFAKAKQDISSLKSDMVEIKQILKELLDAKNTQKLHELHKSTNSTVRQINATDPVTSTDNATVPWEIEGVRSPNLDSSTGNEGASTDRQTDRQTDTSTHFLPEIPQKSIEKDIYKASEILDSLDALKKQIRLKFKKITNQEMAVFSTIYQLEEQNKQPTTYKETALKLGLSQSSIRDYIQRMINKGIPIKKHKINNKKLILSISPELKRVATLNTIIQLRGL